MKPLSGFIISIFLLLFLTPFFSLAQQKDCKKVDITVDITDSANGQKGSIKVTTRESGTEFMLHLVGHAETKENNQFKITNGSIENIPPGKYDLIIQFPEGHYCSEIRKVTLN